MNPVAKYISASAIAIIAIAALLAPIHTIAGNFGKPSAPIPTGFTWGGDFGSSIDMTSNGMSSIDANMYFGYKNSVFRTVGIGAGIQSSLGNPNTFYPIFAIMRTNFTGRPSLCFMELKGGYSFNSIHNQNQKGMYASIGLGFNLYTSEKLRSHIILAYNFFDVEPYDAHGTLNRMENLHCMSVRIGVSF